MDGESVICAAIKSLFQTSYFFPLPLCRNSNVTGHMISYWQNLSLLATVINYYKQLAH